MASSSGEEDSYEEDLEDLFDMQNHIISYWCLSARDVSAGRLDSDVLKTYTRESFPGIVPHRCVAKTYRGDGLFELVMGRQRMNNQSTQLFGVNKKKTT